MLTALAVQLLRVRPAVLALFAIDLFSVTSTPLPPPLSVGLGVLLPHRVVPLPGHFASGCFADWILSFDRSASLVLSAPQLVPLSPVERAPADLLRLCV